MPEPLPTEAQVVTVREIAGLTSRAITESLVGALSNAEWAAALALLEEWPQVRRKFARLKGKVELDPEDRRRAIRHEMRRLLGLEPFTDEERGPAVAGSTTVGVEVSW